MFYGRARALAAVKEALRAQAGRNCAFLLIFGMSGSGKSSLVRAGLLHALTATPGWIPGVDVWRWCVVRPGDATGDPLDALAQAFFGDTALPELRVGGIDAARLARTLRDNPDDVDLILGPALRAVAGSERERRAADRPLAARLLVVVDQMEEIFTRDWLDEPGRAALRGRAGGAGAERGGVGRRHHAQRVLRAVRRAPRAGGAQGGPGSARPAAADLCRDRPDDSLPGATPPCAGGKDPDNPGQTLDDVLQEAAWRDPKALPLLQFTLNELFRRRRTGHTLTCEAYRALGGLEGALANHAEATLAALPPEVRAALAAALARAGHRRRGRPRAGRVAPRAAGAAPSRSRPQAAARRPDRRAAARDRPRRPDAAGRRHRARGLARALAAAQGPAGRRIASFFECAPGSPPLPSDGGTRDAMLDFLLHEGKPLAEARKLLKTRRDDLDADLIDFVEYSLKYIARNRRRRTHVIVSITGITLILVFPSIFSIIVTLLWQLRPDLNDYDSAFARLVFALDEYKTWFNWGNLPVFPGSIVAASAFAEIRSIEWRDAPSNKRRRRGSLLIEAIRGLAVVETALTVCFLLVW